MANAPPPVPPVPPDQHALDLLTAARTRKTAFSEAMEQYENAVWQAAWDRGHQQGWAEGYAHAFWVMEQARTQQAAPAPPARAEPPTAPPLEEEEPSTSAQDIVWSVVNAKPGLRGVEIVAETEAMGKAVKERTVRTALHRLKKDGLIINRDERWYPPEAAPGGLQQVDLD
ncbi:MAG: hypothetical protein K2X34_09295 [Hyphomonadaceae bacterium]|nr:hypothetical protein [Hyphomonadaceae bacterium]